MQELSLLHAGLDKDELIPSRDFAALERANLMIPDMIRELKLEIV